MAAGVSEKDLLRMRITETAHETGIAGVSITDLRSTAIVVGEEWNINDNKLPEFFDATMTAVLAYEPGFSRYAMVRPSFRGVTTVVPISVKKSDLSEEYVRCGPDDLVLKLDIQPALITVPSGEKRSDYIGRTFIEEIQEVAEYILEQGDPRMTVLVALTHKGVIDRLAADLPRQFAAAQVSELDVEALDELFVSRAQQLIARSIDAAKVRGKQTDPEKVRPYIIAIRVSDFLAAESIG